MKILNVIRGRIVVTSTGELTIRRGGKNFRVTGLSTEIPIATLEFYLHDYKDIPIRWLAISGPWAH